MDFIECLIGISPDGGDGSTELLYIGLLVLVAVAILLARRKLLV
jgi:LPXTG-motif cell wall-anchored protein